MSDKKNAAEGRGTQRCPGVSWDELAEGDSRPVPAFLREDAYRFLGSEPLAAERYTSPEFHRREVEKMVKPNERGEVAHRVEKRKQAAHAPRLREPVPATQFAQRRHRQRCAHVIAKWVASFTQPAIDAPKTLGGSHSSTHVRYFTAST